MKLLYNIYTYSAKATHSSTMTTDHVHDLPLMANSKAFHLYHYAMHLTCHMDRHTFSGCIYLFLNPARSSSDNRQVFSLREYQQQMADMCSEAATEGEEGGRTGVPAQSEVSSTHVFPGRSSGDWDWGEVRQSGEVKDGGGVMHDGKVIKGGSEVMHDTEVMCGSGDVKRQRLDAHCHVEPVHDTLITTTRASLYDTTSYLPHASVSDGQPTEQVPATLVLDACDLQVTSVHEVEVTEVELQDIARASLDKRTSVDSMAMYMQRCDDAGRRTVPMRHLVEKWCIKVWKDGVTEYSRFPRLIKIVYATVPEGNSVRWAKDQDDK